MGRQLSRHTYRRASWRRREKRDEEGNYYRINTRCDALHRIFFAKIDYEATKYLPIRYVFSILFC